MISATALMLLVNIATAGNSTDHFANDTCTNQINMTIDRDAR
jgi:hypothetical protein